MATCFNLVLGRDFQQPEHSAAPGALTSMQLPHRTVSFIMKGLKQAPPHSMRMRAHKCTRTQWGQMFSGRQVTSSIQEEEQQNVFHQSPSHLLGQHELRITDAVSRRDLHRRSKKTAVKTKQCSSIFIVGAKLFFNPLPLKDAVGCCHPLCCCHGNRWCH